MKIEIGSELKSPAFSFRKRVFHSLVMGMLVSAFLFTGNNVLASPSAIIYDNGGVSSGATTKSGVVATSGTQWSEAQNDFGVTNYSNSTAGTSCSVTATIFRCADDFNIPVGQSWTINQVIVFAYQTGGPVTNPFAAGTLQIWNGRPGDPGSTIVFGDTTTNRLGTVTDSTFYRIFNTVVGNGANPPSAPGTTRRIWQVALNVAPGLVLNSGNYWIDWNTQIGTTTAHFAPTATTVGTRNLPGSNSRQFTGAAWQDSIDLGITPTGNPAPVPLPQEFPFKLDGTVSGAPLAPMSRASDFNGDNKSDFVLARSASAITQSTWHIQTNGGGVSGIAWGLGVGFPTGDRPTPADFDGDGKTDVAVWRPGVATVASFYVLKSSDNTASVIPFGQTGDDPSIVGDYDGDGKADAAVYRNGIGGGQSTFYYRGTLNNSGGNVSFAPWGIQGDIAVPGDFDGDRKADFSVARNSGGQMVHYQLRSSAGFIAFPFGLNTDKYLTGDFDGDGRSDLGAVRANGSSFEWYVLRSSTGQLQFEVFGNPTTDFLVPGDYDGDNKTDFAVWRSGASQNNFFVRNSFGSPMQVTFGASAGSLTAPDYPVASFSVK